MTEETRTAFRKLRAATKVASGIVAASADDDMISKCAELYDEWAPDTEYVRGIVVRRAGGLYQLVVDRIRSEAHQPPNAEGMLAVWRPVQPSAQPGEVLPWVYGEKVEFSDRREDEGIVYECYAPDGAGANVWQPKAAPAIWRIVEV